MPLFYEMLGIEYRRSDFMKTIEVKPLVGKTTPESNEIPIWNVCKAFFDLMPETAD